MATACDLEVSLTSEALDASGSVTGSADGGGSGDGVVIAVCVDGVLAIRDGPSSAEARCSGDTSPAAEPELERCSLAGTGGRN